jgi:RimJ/RimL family protein N-acetyltransferase
MNDVLSTEIEIIPIKPEHQVLLYKIVEEIAQLKRENNGESFIDFGDKNTKLFSHQGIIKGFTNVHSTAGVPYLDVFIFREFRGQGLGPAVTVKLKQQLFDRGYDVVGIRVHKNNKRAMASAEKSGFTLIDEGVELNSENQEGTYYEFIARNYRNANDRGYNH